MSPVEFYELPQPQGTPSISPVSIATGYCSASDVCSLNKSRLPGVGNNPTLSDIDGYIVMVAGQVDAVMLAKGYNVPVNTASYPETEGLLAWVNSTGAAWMMEESSPTSTNIDRLKAGYDAALKMLSEAQFVLDVPVETARATARAPWLTYRPTGEVYDPTFGGTYQNNGDGISGANASNDPRNPYFSRTLRF